MKLVKIKGNLCEEGGVRLGDIKELTSSEKSPSKDQKVRRGMGGWGIFLENKKGSRELD